jgi:hypothetical protein
VAGLFFDAFLFAEGADFFATAPVLAGGFCPKASPQLLAYFFVAPIRMMATVVLLVVLGRVATAKRGATWSAANED